MRCLILIALGLTLANAKLNNQQRFARLLNSYGSSWEEDRWDESDIDEYQPRRRIGGLHDIIGQGYYPGQETCSRQNSEQWVDDDEYDENETGLGGKFQTRNRWVGGEWDVDEWDQGEYETGRYGRNEQSTYDDESEFGYGNERIGECKPNPRMWPKLENINCHLATSLYKQARRERDDKNIVVSPVAVLLGLGALNVGARGRTKKEIGLIGGECPSVDGLSALLRMWKKGDVGRGRPMRSGGRGWSNDEMVDRDDEQECTGRQCTQIEPITGIFVAKTTPSQKSFVRIVRGCLGVEVQKCDFQRQPEQCRQRMNRYVQIKSQNKMPRLVPKDAVTDNTKMIVVTGLQLKAEWGKEFKNHQTVRGVFHPLDGLKAKRVPMMQKRGLFKYHEDDTVKVVGIPTRGHELTVYVILPKCEQCLSDVEKEELLEGDQLKRLLDNCDQRKQRVDVRLPKFQIKHKIDAKRTLLNKGMINMFEHKTADFSGITGCVECSQKIQQNLRRPLGQRSSVVDENDYTTERGQIHLNKFFSQATIKITDSGITAAGPQETDYQNTYEGQEYSGRQYGQNEQEEEYEIENEDENKMYDERSWMTGRDRFDEMVGLGRGWKKTFDAKHPFVFVVRHNPSKQILLMGRVIDAAQKQPWTPPMEEIYPSQFRVPF